MNTLRPILLVEDNPDDVFIFKRVLAKTGLKNPILVFEDGTAAVEYLAQVTTSNLATSLPAVIFTDLKMSEMGGVDFCRWVRGQPSLQSLITFVLSGSELERDIAASNAAGSNGYLVKFPTSEELIAILRDAAGPLVPDVGRNA